MQACATGGVCTGHLQAVIAFAKSVNVWSLFETALFLQSQSRRRRRGRNA